MEIKDNPELVDLGLPSGNLWMTKNLGASNNISQKSWYGQYFQTLDLTGYRGQDIFQHANWKSDLFNNGEDHFNVTYNLKNKYKFIYKNNVLKSQFDPVTKIYGKYYKMPTKQDIDELIQNTSMTWVTDYKGVSYINGVLFKAKNNEELFLPAGGFYVGYGVNKNRGKVCVLRSTNFVFHSQATKNVTFRECLPCEDNSIGNVIMHEISMVRSCCLPIRGIKVKDEYWT